MVQSRELEKVIGAHVIVASVASEVSEKIQDPAEIIKLRKENEALRKQLEDAVTLQQSATHDLRQPLTPIKGYAQLLIRRINGGLTDPKQLLTPLHAILTAAQGMDLEITKTLDCFDTLKSPAPEAVSIREIMESVRNRYKIATASREQKLVVALPSPSIKAYVDSNRVGRVISTVLLNACKFTPNKGTIKMWYGIPEDQNMRFQEIKIYINDNGCGMSAEKLSTCMTGCKSVTGSGLGLKTELAEIKAEGGDLRPIWSKVGAGSTFATSIPLFTP